jgi:hypothetical protein
MLLYYDVIKMNDMRMKYTIDEQDKVVIGSGTIIESYFQIANFMNMLYGNIAQEHWSMTNKVIRHNIETYFNHINKDNLSNKIDEIDIHLYNVLYKDIIDNLDMLIENMEMTYKLINQNKQHNIKEVNDLIESMKQSSYLKYEMVWSSIKKCYQEYKFIKNY